MTMRCVLLILTALTVCACPSEPAPSDEAAVDARVGDGAGSDSAGLDSGDVGAECGAPTNDAPLVRVETMASKFPAATGGLFVPGKYHLTRVEIRGGASGTREFMRSVQVDSTTWHESDRDPTASMVDKRSAASISVTGTSIALTSACGERASRSWVFSSSPESFQLMDVPVSGGDSFERFTYTRVGS